MSSFVSRITSSKHFRFGAPFFLFIFGGQYALRTFRELRYDSTLNPRGNKNLLTPEEAFGDLNEKAGKGKVHFKLSNKTAEEELEDLDKKIDWDNWENKRGPRPWEKTEDSGREAKRIKDKHVPTVKELLGN